MSTPTESVCGLVANFRTLETRTSINQRFNFVRFLLLYEKWLMSFHAHQIFVSSSR
eukprot:UN11000